MSGDTSALPMSGALAPEPGGEARASSMDPAEIAAAIASNEQQREAEIDEAARADVPADPSDYRMPERGLQDEALDVPQIQALQALGHAIGATPGEFKLLVMQGQVLARANGGRAMSPIEMELADRRVVADLERVHGEDRAATIAGQAVRVIARAKAHDANLGAVLQEVALQGGRPLVEMLARVGRRMGR